MLVPKIPSGILNINKPQGITSHDVVDVIRKIFPNKKIGHTGTLDPLATGVLPICIGDATKLTNDITSGNKEYRVKALLGVETDTYDITGRIMFASIVDKDEIYIKERIKRFVGKCEQVPPMYSAIRIDGKHAYSYAREGKTVKLLPRSIEIFSIDNIDVNVQKREVSFDVSCTKGTYIRSLINDIGKKIGCGATMISLDRTRTGNFNIQNSNKLYDFLRLDYDDMISKIITIEEYFSDSKRINLNENEYNKFLNGMILQADSSSGIVRIYCNSRYRGLGKVENNKLKRYIIEETN